MPNPAEFSAPGPRDTNIGRPDVLPFMVMFITTTTEPFSHSRSLSNSWHGAPA